MCCVCVCVTLCVFVRGPLFQMDDADPGILWSTAPSGLKEPHCHPKASKPLPVSLTQFASCQRDCFRPAFIRRPDRFAPPRQQILNALSDAAYGHALSHHISLSDSSRQVGEDPRALPVRLMFTKQFISIKNDNLCATLISAAELHSHQLRLNIISTKQFTRCLSG